MGEEISRRGFLEKAAVITGLGVLFKKRMESKEKKANKEKKEKKEQISFEEVYKNPEKFKVISDNKFNDNFNNSDTREIFGIQSFVVDKNSGKIFFTNFRGNTAYFYDSEGNLDKDKIIDKKGKGPGDLYYPKIGGIFDNKLFVINLYSPTQWKLDTFDFEGRNIESLILNGSISHFSKLEKNIFYLSDSFKEKEVINQEIVKFSNGEYKKIDSYKEVFLSVSGKRREKPFHFIKNKYCFAGKRSLVSNENFAILSHSEDNFIQVINKEGEISKINVFSEKDKEKIDEKKNKKHADLIKKREKECQEEINTRRYKRLKESEEENEVEYARKQALRKIKENRREYLPYYDEIIIDSQENILFISRDKRKVFAYKLSEDKKSISKLGEFDDKTELGKKILSSESKVALNNDSILGFWGEEDEESFLKFDIERKK